jgi:hypothetical protein
MSNVKTKNFCALQSFKPWQQLNKAKICALLFLGMLKP